MRHTRPAGHGKPKLAVWKFASCDGCQLSILNCEDELLAIAAEVEIAHFLEASRAVVRGRTISPWSKDPSRRSTTRRASSRFDAPPSIS